MSYGLGKSRSNASLKMSLGNFLRALCAIRTNNLVA